MTRDLLTTASTLLVCATLAVACSSGGSGDNTADPGWDALPYCPSPDTISGAGPDTASSPDISADIFFGVDVDEAPTPGKTEWLFDDDAAPHELRVTVAPEDWTWLQEHALEEEYVPASIELVGGERNDDAAIRYKGAYGSLYACFDAQGERLCPKLSLKLSFNKYDKKGRFYGVRKFILNSCNRDASCLRERLSYSLFRDAGVEASRAVHVSVTVNDGPPSFYLLVEAVDHEFLEDHFEDPDGNLYKEIWPQYDEPAPYESALETNEDDGDVGRLVDLASFVRENDIAADPTLLDPWLDRDTLLSYFAVDQLTNNWDGVSRFYCMGDVCGNHNFFLYEDPTSDRVVVVPWDLDHTFNRPNRDMARSWWDDAPELCEPDPMAQFASFIVPQCDPLLRGAMRGDWAAYVARLQALVGGDDAPLSEAHVLARLDRYRAQLWPLVEADPAGPTLTEWRRAVAELRQIIRTQWSTARTFVEAPGP